MTIYMMGASSGSLARSNFTVTHISQRDGVGVQDAGVASLIAESKARTSFLWSSFRQCREYPPNSEGDFGHRSRTASKSLRTAS